MTLKEALDEYGGRNIPCEVLARNCGYREDEIPAGLKEKTVSYVEKTPQKITICLRREEP